ncbi:acyl carrier protein [Marinicrinis sediminis]|uniref:Acyl carrier protein n=1 Tax=Marinicrinis sediminis TaxID=1652465 RepID=A0ABW5R7D8_9BACL
MNEHHQRIEEMQQLIAQICREKMNMEVEANSDSSAPIEVVYGLDSISLFELIVNLEEKYERKVPDEDIEKIGKMNAAELLDYFEGQGVHE